MYTQVRFALLVGRIARLRSTAMLGTAVILAALFSVMPSAHAQNSSKSFNQSNDASINDVNGCTQEPIAGTGHSQIHQMIQQNNSGFMSKFDEHENGTLTGQLTGAQYQYQDFEENQFKASTMPAYVHITNIKHAIRQGDKTGADSFFITIVERCNFGSGGKAMCQVEKTSSKCK